MKRKKWEYKTIIVRFSSFSLLEMITVEDLNKLGQEGWELIAHHYFFNGDGEKFYLKREIITE